MSTHASKRILKLRELGKALYRAMKADWEWCDTTGEAPLAEEFTPILEWWRNTENPNIAIDLSEAVAHAGLPKDDAKELLDYISRGPLLGEDGTPVLNTRHLWELVQESIDDEGNAVPMPDDWSVAA